NTKNHIRSDNVFYSVGLEDKFMQCSIEFHLCPIIINHFPIISVLDLQLEHTLNTPQLNYCQVSWEDFSKILTSQLNIIPLP
ncbi:hypothetical protein BDR06DRAFT_848264, partial [Suillus hirtellus]